MNTKLFSQLERYRHPAEKNNLPSITERGGYMPAKVRIEQFFQAGVNLENYRKQQFDYSVDDNIDIDNVDIDPTRSKSYDFDDAHDDLNHLREVEERVMSERKKVSEEAKLKAEAEKIEKIKADVRAEIEKNLKNDDKK